MCVCFYITIYAYKCTSLTLSVARTSWYCSFNSPCIMSFFILNERNCSYSLWKMFHCWWGMSDRGTPFPISNGSKSLFSGVICPLHRKKYSWQRVFICQQYGLSFLRWTVYCLMANTLLPKYVRCVIIIRTPSLPSFPVCVWMFWLLVFFSTHGQHAQDVYAPRPLHSIALETSSFRRWNARICVYHRQGENACLRGGVFAATLLDLYFSWNGHWQPEGG